MPVGNEVIQPNPKEELLMITSSMPVGAAQGGGHMPNGEDPALLKRIKAGLDVLVDDDETTRKDLELWLTLGPAEEREFPGLEGVEMKKTITVIRERLKNEKLKSKVKRRSVREKIYMIADFGTPPPDLPGAMDSKMNGNTFTFINDEMMGKYFQRARETKKDHPDRGIPHDYDSLHGFKGHNPDAWLPGVFLTDEIFRALLWTVYRKVDAFSKAAPGAKTQARKDLDAFVAAISNNDYTNAEAARFLPFFNHHKDKKVNPPPADETYIKLVPETGEPILGMIVQVGDWAGGSHSNGSAAHYP